jgi:hypothetical protein
VQVVALGVLKVAVASDGGVRGERDEIHGAVMECIEGGRPATGRIVAPQQPQAWGRAARPAWKRSPDSRGRTRQPSRRFP